MDQYAGSPGHSTYSYAELIASFMNFLHLLDFMEQGKITEENAPTIRLDATPSRLLEPPSPSPPPIFTPNALSATTLPIYPGLEQAPNNGGWHTQWLGF